MGVGLQVVDDLIAGDAGVDGAPDGFTCNPSRDHVRIPCREPREEREDGDGQRGCGVGVETVVGFDDDKAW